VALRIQRLATKWTARAAGPDQRLGTANKRARLRSVDPDSEQIWPLFGIVGQLHVVAVLRGRLRLDHDRLGSRIPGQRHGPHAEELDNGFIERELVNGIAVRWRVDRVKQIIQPMSEGRDLNLLESDAYQRAALSGLEKEGSIAGLTERSGEETIGTIENKESPCHRAHRSACRPGTVLVLMSTMAVSSVN